MLFTCLFLISFLFLLNMLILTFSPFYFQVFRAALLSLFWILFQVDCLFPLHLFGLVSFYLTLSFVLYFSVFSYFFFSLTSSSWGLIFPGFSVVFLLPFGFCLVEGNVDWVICVDFLLRVTCFCLLVGGNQANQEVITEIMRYIHTLPHIQL